MKTVNPIEHLALLNFATEAANRFFKEPDMGSCTESLDFESSRFLALRWDERTLCIIRKDTDFEPMLFNVTYLTGSIAKLSIVRQSDVDGAYKDGYNKGYEDGDTRGYHRGRADGARFDSRPNYWNYEDCEKHVVLPPPHPNSPAGRALAAKAQQNYVYITPTQ
jgi:hypothetical protein